MYKIFKYTIPVDDNEHLLTVGRVLHVDCLSIDRVTFWAESNPKTECIFLVVGTGHDVPNEFAYVGTAVTPVTRDLSRGALVWHLFYKPLDK